jgi:translocation and assembly module TamB
MARFRTTAKRVGWVLAGVVILLALVFAFLQTGPGLAALERGIETALSSQHQRVEIEGLEGRVPDRLTIDQITVSDSAGSWLSAQEISLSWRPLRLLGGLLHVERLTTARLSVVRLPDSDQTASKTDPAALAVPQLPFALRVDLLSVEAIDLQPAVIGTPAGLRLTGSLSTEVEATIQTVLEVERTDGPLGSVSVKSSYALTDRTLDLDAQLREPADGLVAQLLGIAGLPEIELSLVGRGPVADWRGHLAAKSGDVTNIEADLSVAAGDTVEFTAGGSADLQAFAPAAYRDLLSPAMTFSAIGAWDKSTDTVRIADARF